MTISIVMTTYNGQDYIIEQLESVMTQSRQADEVLIFDDRSSDNTAQIVETFIREHELKGWKLIVNEQNKGWKRNFMEGMHMSSGELIFTSDQDDVWKPQKLEVMERIMAEHDNIDLLVSNWQDLIDGEPSDIKPRNNDKNIIPIFPDKNYLLVTNPGCTYCIRRRLEAISQKYWEADFPHDALLWRLAMFSNTLFSYNGDLILYRQHDDSTFVKDTGSRHNRSGKVQWNEYAVRVTESIIKFMDENEISNPDYKNLLTGGLNWLKARSRFYDSRNIFRWVALIRYLNYYPWKKAWLTDLYFGIFKSNE